VTESLTEEPEVSVLLIPNSVVGNNSDPPSPIFNLRETNMNAVIYICYEDLEQSFMNYKYPVPSVSYKFTEVEINPFCTKAFAYYEQNSDRQDSEEGLCIPLR
jgi:hypothetical protein